MTECGVCGAVEGMCVCSMSENDMLKEISAYIPTEIEKLKGIKLKKENADRLRSIGKSAVQKMCKDVQLHYLLGNYHLT